MQRRIESISFCVSIILVLAIFPHAGYGGGKKDKGRIQNCKRLVLGNGADKAEVLPNQISEPKGFKPTWPSKDDYGLDPKINEQRTATLEVLKLLTTYMDSNELDNEVRLKHAERILEFAENLEHRFPNANSKFLERYSVPSEFVGSRIHFRWQEDPEVMANLATSNAIQQAKIMKNIIPKLRANAMKIEFSDESSGDLQLSPSGMMHKDAILYDVSGTVLYLSIKMLDPDSTEIMQFPKAYRATRSN